MLLLDCKASCADACPGGRGRSAAARGDAARAGRARPRSPGGRRRRGGPGRPRPDPVRAAHRRLATARYGRAATDPAHPRHRRWRCRVRAGRHRARSARGSAARARCRGRRLHGQARRRRGAGDAHAPRGRRRGSVARTQAEFRRVIERSPLGVIARRGTRIAYANGAAARILAIARHELVGTVFFDLVSEEFREVMERRAQRFDRTGAAPPPIEAQLIRGDGRRITARVIPVTRASFEGADVTFVMFEDITARTSAERRLRMTQFAVDRVGDLIVWIESGGTITYANTAAGELLGAAPAELVGRRFAELVIDRGPHDWPAWRAMLQATGTVRFDTHFRDHCGRSIAVVATASALSFDGETFVVVSARDVSERERLRNDLQRAERLASVGSLAAGVAHEINNPLAYVLANLELLAEGLTNESITGVHRARLAELVAGCRDGADRVRRIVGDLGAFARQHDEDSAPLDLHRTLDTAIGLADNQIRHRGRLLRAYGPPLAVRAHEGRLTQVFVNLLINAAQALPEGRPADEQSITVTTAPHGEEWAAIAFTDTGVGIEAGLLGRIFEPFFTTKPQGEGTGLGLSICHGIIESFGGRIEVESTLGVGTTFRVILARAGVLVASDTLPTRREQVVDRSPAGGSAVSLRILVVDDEPLLGESVARTLDGHAVRVARTGGEAIACCDRDDYDLVLCDLMMPEVSGMDVYEIVRRHKPELAPRFVFMTGGAFTPKAKSFLEGFAGESLTKPFALTELRSLVERWAQRHGARSTGS
ncbi:MAG: PAS domain S-box protein [Deltaproteobacteria bacterium]|nr:PAS domain S-box protein [Nannocystaceae bacterium]